MIRKEATGSIPITVVDEGYAYGYCGGGQPATDGMYCGNTVKFSGAGFGLCPACDQFWFMISETEAINVKEAEGRGLI